MNPCVVVDVGNSRIKWGLCDAVRICATCSLPPDDPEAWSQQLIQWTENRSSCLSAPRKSWVVAGVHPPRREQFVEWLRESGQTVRLLDDPNDLPLRVLVERPDYVGVDRLLDAVAANSRRTTGTPAVVIDAGSAITVDLVDGTGAFAGGAILPGMRLMAKALHDYTALLPLIPPPEQPPAIPGTATPSAMELGIFWAAAGGIQALLRESRNQFGPNLDVFFTGGDGPLLHTLLPEAHLWPEMTLEGIRLSAEALP
ncbi:MAG TPA: type III pantothenate kinase [Gemmataceae bacterium]|nr:type III pantothenate kinase [Gemmataceae bacterium]